MYSRVDEEKINNKGFSLIELIVSIAICVIVAGAIGALLSGSLSNFDYNQTTIGMQIESQQYVQRIGNFIQTTGYAVYTEKVNDDIDDLYLYSLDNNPGAAQNVICDVYKAMPTSATYRDGANTKNLYTIEHYSMVCPKMDFDSGVANWSGAGSTSAEPLAGGIAEVHYRVYDMNGTYVDSGAFAGTGTTTLKAPQKVTVSVKFMSKNRKLKLDDSSFFFRNSTVNKRSVRQADGTYTDVIDYTNNHPTS